MHCVTLARHAMATRFELVLHGENPAALRAAGEEALDEIDRLEEQLSLFRPTSEIAYLNARASREPVKVSPPLFGLLQHAQRIHDETGGAFDITIAPLVRCWGFMGGSGQMPRPEEVQAARERTGMSLVQLAPENLTVKFARPGVMLDLGAIGKGYAIERATEFLVEAGINSALLHGGTSTLVAIGAPPGEGSWKIAIQKPEANERLVGAPAIASSAAPAHAEPPLFTFELKDQAMSVSAIWGKFFQAEGKIFGHIIDPRTGAPATGTLLSAVVLKSATETDALSTALLVMGAAGHRTIANLRSGIRTLLVSETGDGYCVETLPDEQRPG
jgi:thiamine biosynthesis lipoprotein